MKVFLAGGSGAIGSRLVPLLVADGHDVLASTTSSAKLLALRDLGAEGVVLDVLDRNAVMTALLRAEPDVVIHQATALAELGSFRNVDKSFAVTNRLRTEGTDNLLECRARGRSAQVHRAELQRLAEREEGQDDQDGRGPAFDDDPPRGARQAMAAIRHPSKRWSAVPRTSRAWCSATAASTGQAPRWPRTAYTRIWSASARFPIVGDGTGVWFLPPHRRRRVRPLRSRSINGAPGLYNVVDDGSRPGQRVAAGAGRGAQRAGAAPRAGLARQGAGPARWRCR